MSSGVLSEKPPPLQAAGAGHSWSMGNGYEHNLTIDRINANGNYCICQNNLRWADKLTQSRNQRIRYDNKSGNSGVRFVGWIAHICVDKKKIYLGEFNTFEEAVNARKQAEIKYWGFNK